MWRERSTVLLVCDGRRCRDSEIRYRLYDVETGEPVRPAGFWPTV